MQSTDPAPTPPTAEPTPLQRDLMRKHGLELDMIADPLDERLRRTYFDELSRFAAVRTGLAHAVLPELGHPVAFRCGTADIVALVRAFRERAYDFPMRATPARILVCGAYVGYAALALAHRFPAAQVMCVEPMAASFRVLTMNTLPIRRIQAVNVAVWHGSTRLGVQTRALGDLGAQLHDQLADEERVIPAYSVGEVLRAVGWEQADLVVLDILGAEQAVFADPGQRWLERVDTLAVACPDAGRDAFTGLVRAALDPQEYGQAEHGDFLVWERHVPFRAMARPVPRDMALICGEAGHFPIALQDVAPTPWGFFVFDGESCQLHPNGPGESPARAHFPRTLSGHTRFAATLRHAGRPSIDVIFTFQVTREDGVEVVHEQWAVGQGERREVTVDLPALHGRHHLILQTAMPEGAQHNYNAWAQWLSPRVS